MMDVSLLWSWSLVMLSSRPTSWWMFHCSGVDHWWCCPVGRHHDGCPVGRHHDGCPVGWQHDGNLAALELIIGDAVQQADIMKDVSLLWGWLLLMVSGTLTTSLISSRPACKCKLQVIKILQKIHEDVRLTFCFVIFFMSVISQS